MNKIIETWEKLDSKFEHTPANYRLPVLLSSLLIIFSIWFIIVDTPISRKHAQLTKDLRTNKIELVNIQQAITTQMSNTAGNINEDGKHTNLEQELASLEQQISSINNQNLIKKKLAQLLQDFVNPNDNLQLRSLKWIDQSSSNLPSDMVNTKLAVSFDADYFSMLGYLKRLELAGIPVYLRKMNYTVTTAPAAAVELDFDVYSKKTDSIK